MNRSLGFTADLLCAGLAVFAVIVAAIGVFDMVVVSGLTVLLGLLICFFRMEHDKSQEAPNRLRLALHGLMALALVYIFWEWGVVMFEQEETIISISLRQNGFAWVAIALISYLTYRFFGIPMLAVMAVSAAYLLLPSTLGGARHRLEARCRELMVFIRWGLWPPGGGGEPDRLGVHRVWRSITAVRRGRDFACD